jgi:uncharacterized protein (TIGR00661 family)
LTNGGFFNKKKVLVAPLDWGLGHATRCIPIIHALLKLGAEVLVAGSENQKLLLKHEFPQLEFLPLQGYEIKYSRSKAWLPFRLLLQVPRILSRIKAERTWLKKLIVSHSIDVVISDNRFGLYHRKICSIYITHQLQIQTRFLLTDWCLQKFHYHFINKYNYCWVPDAPVEENLAGKLSHPSRLPITRVTYIGPLSRMNNISPTSSHYLVCVLSGPEPQRSILESTLLGDLENISYKALLVRGLPGETALPLIKNTNVEIYNHLPTASLNEILAGAKWIICRSGYTSIMDLVKLKKPAILIPTPGQTEQEYLANYLESKKIFISDDQNHFDLNTVINKAEKFPFTQPAIDFEIYQIVLAHFQDDKYR